MAGENTVRMCKTAYNNYKKPNYDIGQIFHQHLDFIDQHTKLTAHQKRILRAIAKCRTPALGTHKLTCTDCGTVQIVYNSCRNRNCPKCQNRQRNLWLEARADELLPVPYFHLVFTLPSALHELCLQHRKQVGAG